MFRRNDLDAELNDELLSHLAMLVEDNLRKGMPLEEARMAARRTFGGIDQTTEIYRDQRGLPVIETLLQDLRFAVRILGRNPGFTTVAVIALALGIGANTAIFSVVNAVLLKPLPYPHADRIVDVWHTPPQESFPGIKKFAVSPGNFLDWQKGNHVFQEISAFTFARHNLGAAGSPVSVMSGIVTAEFFRVLQINPRFGRPFTPDDDQPGSPKVVILGDAIWKSQFGSNPNILGQPIKLDGQSYTVVGIMQPGFHYPQVDQFSSQIWTPVVWTDADREVRANHNYLAIARLKDGVTVSKAQSEMNAISAGLQQDHLEEDKDWGAVVIPLRDDLVGDVRPALVILLGAVAFVLLIACANVTNLLLARAAGRSREIAVRTSRGASRSRVVRQLLSESMLLGAIGGAFAIALAQFGVKALVRLAGPDLPGAEAIGIDAGVLGLTLGVSL
ncbi:MAG TPA: ABC transporter permease, partial [Blastocatellia bacterium]|nr:ABC transporter permease [Blastocatellia bacterium]